jgi:hypothetical protein
MKDVFLNIIILFSPNYKHEKINIRGPLGTTTKSISRFVQFTAFYKSIKLNLKSIKYDISIVHYNNFNEQHLKKLNNMDVNLIKCNVDTLDDLGIGRYIVKTKIKGTHRLIAETDMLLLKEPTFNWNVDFQKMYSCKADFPPEIMSKIYKMFNIQNKYINNYSINKNLFVLYNINKINKNNLFPHFNNGLTLIKEDFSEKYYKKFISLDSLNKRNKYFAPWCYHFFGQMLQGLILLELTDNWEPFEPGINYQIKVYNVNKFGKENISILHYCGVGGGEQVKIHFPEYF